MAISLKTRERIIAVMEAERQASTDGRIDLTRVSAILLKDGIDLSKTQAMAFALQYGYEATATSKALRPEPAPRPQPKAARRPRRPTGQLRGPHGPQGPRSR